MRSALTVKVKNESIDRPDINYDANSIVAHGDNAGKRFVSFLCSDTIVTIPAERVLEIRHWFHD